MEQAYLNGKTELELIPQGTVRFFFPPSPMLKLIVVAGRESPLLRSRDSRLLLGHWITHFVRTRQVTHQVQLRWQHCGIQQEERDPRLRWKDLPT
jgi:hypothetical protein